MDQETQQDTQAEISPIASAIKGRCPRCGKGKLFTGAIKLAPTCNNCDLDLGPYDQADGPAAFAIFLIGPMVLIPALMLEFKIGPPWWVHLILWVPYLTVLTFVFLRLMKSWLVGSQFKAEQAQPEE